MLALESNPQTDRVSQDDGIGGLVYNGIAEVTRGNTKLTMPISYRIDEANERIYTRAEGVVTYDDIRSHMNAEAGRPAASYCEIFDCTGATTNLTVREVRALAAERHRIAENQDAAPVAVVATTDLFFGMLRMFDILTSQVRPIRVFRDIHEAEQWLDTIML